MTISSIKQCLVLSTFLPFFFGNFALADTSHYKEILVSDRATNMGGAYSAVSDDASGAYYNPAGLVFGTNNSMTSLSNTTHFVDSKYDDSVENETEKEKDWRYLINFAGYMKRADQSVYGISYAIDDSTGIRQDQKFDNGTVINKVGDDRSYKYGLSWAHQLEEYFSIGTTFYFYQREYNLQKSRLYDSDDANETWTFEKQEGSELGINLIGGLMWLPADEFSIGLVVKKIFFTHAEHHFQTQNKAAGSSNVVYDSTTNNNYRKTPVTLTMGLAWFPTPSILITGDIDYHKIDDEDKVDVFNFSTGIEYYLTEEYVIRGGIFTNFDNDVEPDSTTTNTEKIDMHGVTLGFSIFNGPSTMITAGGLFSMAEGKAQVDPENPSNVQTAHREVFSYMLAVSINFD